MTTVTTRDRTADAIVADFLRWADPLITQISAETETIARTLTGKPADLDVKAYQAGDAEYKAKVIGSVAALRAPKIRRSQLAMDAADLVMIALRDLSKYRTQVGHETDLAKATAPFSPENAVRVQSLSRLDPSELLAAAEKFAEEDPREADVYLRAAEMGRKLRSTAPGTTFGGIRRKVDADLDRIIPERAAAVRRYREAVAAVEVGNEKITEVRRAVDAILASDPEEPFEAIARARTLVAA